MALTIQDMHRIIEQDVQKMGFAAYQDLAPEEIDLQINRQIGLLIEGILDKHYGRPLKVDERQGFQKNQVTLDNLRNLQVGYFPTTLTSDGNTHSFPLPSNYLHHIKTRAAISWQCYEDGEQKTEIGGVDVRIIQSQHDFRNHPFYKTGKDSPAAEMFGNVIYLYDDAGETFTITSATLSYIRKPAVVKFGYDEDGEYDITASTQCDLDDSLHYMLVNMTSLKIQEILESPQQKIVNSQREIV
jgi:hypothetical protein